MPPRPLHRWKSLWLGLLVLVFLGWAGVASRRQVESYIWVPWHFEATATRGPGYFTMTLAHRAPPATDHHFARSEMKLTAEATALVPWFPRAVAWRSFHNGLMLSIAHWLLIFVFLVPWAGFLIWRVRRMKRLAAESKANAEHRTPNSEC